MDEFGKDNLNKGFTRRDILKAGLGLGVIGALGRVLDGGEQSPFNKKNPNSQKVLIPSDNLNNQLESGNSQKTSPFKEVFGNLNSSEHESARNLVEEMKAKVLDHRSGRWNLDDGSDTLVEKVKESARQYAIDELVALGIVMIESGGHVDATSPVGARGPAQLMPETARSLGLRVDSEVDERINQDKCFKAMCNYLSDMKDFFGGNLGLAVWGYHAGQGNVSWAVQEYLKDTQGVDIGNLKDAFERKNSAEVSRISAEIKNRTVNNNIDVHKLLSNVQVKTEVIPELEDETELYVYKAVGAAEIIKEKLN